MQSAGFAPPSGSESQSCAKNHRWVEIQLRIDCVFDVLGLAKAMLFAGEPQVADRKAFRAIPRLPFFCLIGRRNDLVFVALEEYDGHCTPLCMVIGRARQAKVPLFGIRSDEPVEISGVELVDTPGECLQVADTILAAA